MGSAPKKNFYQSQITPPHRHMQWKIKPAPNWTDQSVPVRRSSNEEQQEHFQKPSLFARAT
jgi:hypothetical protein